MKRTGAFWEIAAVLAGQLLIVVVFAVVSPRLFVPQMPLALRMAAELLPFVLMAGTVALACRLGGRPVWAGLGFRRRHLGRQLAAGLLPFALTAGLFVALPLLLGADRADVLSFRVSSPWKLIYYIIKYMCFVGLGEEIVWRGYLLERILEAGLGGGWAVLISAVLFGLWHYPVGQNLLQVLMTALLGLVWGAARLKIRDCTTLSVGLAHGLHDTTILVLSYFMLT